MRPGGHAASDGSFGRSAGMAAGRGALLLAVAVVLGVLLLNAADDTPTRVGAGRDKDDGDDAATITTTTTQPVPTTVAVRPPREVRLLTANGTNVSGAAGRVSDGLRNLGYNVLAPTDAKPAEASAVYFTPGFEREAQAVAQALQLPPTAAQPLPNPPPVADIRGANVLVVVGPDTAAKVTQRATTTTTSRRGRTTTTARSRR